MLTLFVFNLLCFCLSLGFMSFSYYLLSDLENQRPIKSFEMIKHIFKGRERLNYRIAALLIKMYNSTPYLDCKDNPKAKSLKAKLLYN